MKSDLVARLQTLSREWFTPESAMSKTLDEAAELIKQQRVAIKAQVKRTNGMASVLRAIGENLDACSKIS